MEKDMYTPENLDMPDYASDKEAAKLNDEYVGVIVASNKHIESIHFNVDSDQMTTEVRNLANVIMALYPNLEQISVSHDNSNDDKDDEENDQIIEAHINKKVSSSWIDGFSNRIYIRITQNRQAFPKITN